MPDISVPDIAHLRGASGTFVVPTRSPYDRQLLREHAEMLVGRDAQLTLGVHDTQWIIKRATPPDSACVACTRYLGSLSCHRTGEAGAMCIDCAMEPGKHASMEGLS